jgi:hypothetical protein
MLMTTTPALFDAQERAVYDRLEASVRNVRYGGDWYGYALLPPAPTISSSKAG